MRSGGAGDTGDGDPLGSVPRRTRSAQPVPGASEYPYDIGPGRVRGGCKMVYTDQMF